MELAGEIPTSRGDARLAHLADKLELVDGTLLPALPRMHWALWINDENRAAKLHLKFTVLRQAPRHVGHHWELLRAQGFAEIHERSSQSRGPLLRTGIRFLRRAARRGVSHVIRIRNNPRMEIVEELL